MSFSLAIFLGVIQGLTEFLPISSSGHLVLFQKVFGISEPPVFFDVLLHVGTLLSVLLFLREEMLSEFREFGVLGKIIIGTLPVAVVGLLLNPFVEIIFDSLLLSGLSYFFTAALLLWSKSLAGQRNLWGLSNLEAFVVGLFQAMAILPGVSRSGATVVGGLSQKLDPESAFRFSFYLYIPAVAGAMILQLKDLARVEYLPQSFLGMFLAFVVGFLSLKLFKKILTSQKLYYFSLYCFAIGIFSLLTFFKL